MTTICKYIPVYHNEPAALMLVVPLSLLYSCVNLTHKKTETFMCKHFFLFVPWIAASSVGCMTLSRFLCSICKLFRIIRFYSDIIKFYYICPTDGMCDY